MHKIPAKPLVIEELFADIPTEKIDFAPSDEIEPLISSYILISRIEDYTKWRTHKEKLILETDLCADCAKCHYLDFCVILTRSE